MTKIKLIHSALIVIVYFAACLFGANYTHAQFFTQTEEEKTVSDVNEFFGECLEKPVVPVNAEVDEAFCSCAAAHMHAYKNRPIQSTSRNPFYDPLTSNKITDEVLLANIYGPCLYIPRFEIVYEDCDYDRKIQYFMPQTWKRQGYCHCKAQADADFFEFYAETYLELKLTENMTIKST